MLTEEKRKKPIIHFYSKYLLNSSKPVSPAVGLHISQSFWPASGLSWLSQTLFCRSGACPEALLWHIPSTGIC